ncbi:MAG: PIN domain-containing protein [Acidimicrobiales bacterium]
MTSALSRVEVVRAVRQGGASAVAHARRVLGRVHQVAVDWDLLDEAATIAPGAGLRSLDAMHLAAAQSLGSDLRAIVTYDQRMTSAAGALSIAVVDPQ